MAILVVELCYTKFNILLPKSAQILLLKWKNSKQTKITSQIEKRPNVSIKKTFFFIKCFLGCNQMIIDFKIWIPNSSVVTSSKKTVTRLNHHNINILINHCVYQLMVWFCYGQEVDCLLSNATANTACLLSP